MEPTPAIWKENVATLLMQLADAEYQRRSWFTSDDEIDSPGEMYHALFVSEDFDQFIRSGNVGLNQEQRAPCMELRNALRQFQSKVGSDPPAQVTFGHPDWAQIRFLAAKALTAIST